MEKWSTQGSMFSHVSMNGSSSLFVPSLDVAEFFREYINQVKNGNKLYLVEAKTKLFKFFMDIDYISDDKLTRESIIEIAKRINTCIPGKCLISISKSCKKKDRIKSGIHLHWPDMIVTKKKALDLRLKVPEDLIEFVDESVYKGSGLRMLWSFKKNGDSAYTPFYDLSSDSPLSSDPSVELLKLFSIRSEFDELFSEDQDDLVINEGCHISTFIRQNFKGQENLIIKKMKNEPNKITIQTNSHFCEKIHTNHKSNHVFFVIDKKNFTIFQKCFDSECAKFESRRRRLSPTIKEIITSNINVCNSFWEDS
jgi:hypothetical protein